MEYQILKMIENEFNSKYYSDNNLRLYIAFNNPNNEILEIVNFQTLFGKDYFVILRPSLGFNFENKNNKSLVLIILIFIIKRKKNSLKKYNEDNNCITQYLF